MPGSRTKNGRRCCAIPAILDPDIRTYLEAENDYTESLLGHTTPLQKKLVAEMRGRIKEDDSSVPSPDGPFAYFRKFREGGQHEIFARMPRDGGDATTVLDGDALAATTIISSSARAGIRPTTDCTPGAPTPRVRNIFRSGSATGLTAQTATISSRKPTAAWSGARTARASSTSSSTTTIGRCRSGVIASARQQADDTLVYEEADSGWFTHLHESSSGRFCVIAGGDHETSEQRLIDLAHPDAPPRLVAAREEGVQYSVNDRGDRTFHSYQCGRRHRFQGGHARRWRRRSAPTGAT